MQPDPTPDSTPPDPGGPPASGPGSGPDPFDTGVRPEELEIGKPVPLRTPWGEFALYPTDRGVLCAAMFCPHLDGPLWEGTMSGTEMTCPWHRWRYDLSSGGCVHVPGGELEPGAEASRIQRLTVRLTDAGTYEVLGPAR